MDEQGKEHLVSFIKTYVFWMIFVGLAACAIYPFLK